MSRKKATIMTGMLVILSLSGCDKPGKNTSEMPSFRETEIPVQKMIHTPNGPFSLAIIDVDRHSGKEVRKTIQLKDVNGSVSLGELVIQCPDGNPAVIIHKATGRAAGNGMEIHMRNAIMSLYGSGCHHEINEQKVNAHQGNRIDPAANHAEESMRRIRPHMGGK